ncbi:IS5 family transposase [Caulobacter sp. BE254]|uniref:IS5 family transposase n=1 Tax=Caulobacter sp. BE254 TaxID=2817720 RepID=UPI00285A0422|nr:IS5 family transposase [Caulobacter sp. BE254]MDR7118252.1 IS5 family transposase [Caulobacter sp. BE254]
MSVKATGQLGFGELGLGRRPGSAALERVSGLVDWAGFEKALAGLREDGPGRPGYRPLLLFKALLLQAWYGLSDAELEFRLGDSLSFSRFVGLSLEDAVPDHTTLCRFRNRLVSQRRLEGLFDELDRQLERAGLVLKQGAMLDATLIEAATSRPPHGQEDQAKDPDAAFAKRQGKPGSAYGYKAHVGVDQGSGLVRAVITTPANVNDTTPADDLIRGDEAAVYADKAYDTHARRARLKQAGVKPRLMRRPSQYHPLSARQQRFNDLVARRRAAVETTFATWKRRMGLTRTRYVGLAKVAGQVLLTAMAFNLRRAAVLTA